MRAWRVVALLAAASVVLSGCDFSVFSLPLPGGAKIKGPSYTVTAEFADVLDLVPKSAVKVDDVTVGTVEKVWLEDFKAKVRLRLPKSVQLPDNARATIRQTSLLGEKFVSLGPPPAPEEPRGTLSDGDLIPLPRTSSSVEVEAVLSALSLLLNGGGVAQLQTITRELNKALTGNEPAIRDVLTQLNTFVGGLDKNKQTILKAITAVDDLSKKLNAQKATLATAIDSLPKSIATLDKQRAALVKTLQALGRLGNTAVRVINASQKDLVRDLQLLYPTLTELAKAGDALPKSLELLLTYPFPNGAMDAVGGDFTNLDVTLDVNTQKALKDLHLPTTSIPVPTISVPTLPTALPTSLPTLIPTTAPTALCVTILVPINCPASSGGGGAPAAAAPDGGLAGLMMPGVAP